MSIEIQRNLLLEPLKKADLPELKKVKLDEETAVREFKDRLNAGVIMPMGIDLSCQGSGQEIAEFESQAQVYSSTNIDTQEVQLYKLFQRFIPFIPEVSTYFTPEVSGQFADFLESRGYDSSLPLQEQLQTTGSVFYFPLGLDKKGRLIAEKVHYFPPALEYEMLTASEWELISPKAREKLKSSRLTAVGLSVGSQNVEAALLAGITKFDIADPGTLHKDAGGRLGNFGYDPRFLGVNKTALLLFNILRRYPYVDIRAFYDGITDENKEQIADFQAMPPTNGIWFCSEEVDDFSSKVNIRRAFHSLAPNINWHLIMLGDVGHRVTFSHEQRGDKPFHGFLEKIDPKGDAYGSGLVEKYGKLPALFASVGGFSGIPEPLLTMMKKGEIGENPQAQITRVPQSREATLLSGAVFSSALRMIAEEQEVVSHTLIDVRSKLRLDFLNKEEITSEVKLQEELNNQLFGVERFANFF